MRARLFAVIACSGLIAGSCRVVSVPHARAVPLDTHGVSEVAPEGGVPWSATRRLSWIDYRALPPVGGVEAAATAYSLRWGFHCSGAAFDFQAVAVLFPDRSWVKTALLFEPDSGRRTLQHEQIHFDLSEAYARRMRRFFSTLARPCDRTVEELSALGGRFVSDESDAQHRYDEETANGRDARAQSRWEDDVRKMLDAH